MIINHDLSNIRDNVKDVWLKTIDESDNKYDKEISFLLNWIKNKNYAITSMLRGEGKTPDAKYIDIKLPIKISIELDKNFNNIRRQLIFIRLLIINGNEMKAWKCKIPGIPTLKEREKNKYTTEHVSNIIKYEKLSSVLSKSLKNTDRMTNDEKIGQILLSAIINGVILDIQTLHSFYRSIQNNLILTGECLYVELKPKWQGSNDAELRRYFLDIITTNLILKLSTTIFFKNITTRMLFSYISKFLVSEGYKYKRERPKSLSEILTISKSYYSALSGNIVDYASRAFISHSLTDSAFIRAILNSGACDGKSINLNHQGLWKQSESKVNGEFTKDDRINDEELNDYPWLNEIIKIFENNKRENKLKEELNKELKVLTKSYGINHVNLEIAIYSWCSKLLEGNRNNKPTSRKTVKRFVSLITYGLVEHFGSTPLKLLSPEDFEEAYFLTLENIEKNAQRKRTAHAIYMFHKFLVENHLAPKINYREVLSEAFSPVSVDANIITEDIFQSCLSELDLSGLDIKHPDLLDCVKIIFILGYRCGLRRNEVLKLRKIDISGMSEIHLHVVAHNFRALKTINSQRKIVLNWFLSDKELNLIRNWLKKANSNNFSEFLFSIPDLDYICLHEDLVFHHLHKIMRSISGDSKLRFHHLRHSFATLTFLKLKATYHPKIKEYFKNSPKTYEWLNDNDNFRSRIYSTDKTTRKDLHFISRILGHSSPTITEEHYLHCLDILLAAYRDEYHSIKKTDIVASSPLPKSTAYRLVNFSNDQYKSALLKKYRHRIVTDISKKTERKRISTNDNEFIQFRSNDIYKVLTLNLMHHQPIDQLSERFSYTSFQINQWIRNATNLYDIGSSDKGKPSLRPTTVDGELVTLPRIPKKISEKELAYKYCDKILNSIDHQNLEIFNILYVHIWKTKYQFVFKSNEHLKVILSFISSLGIDKSNIKYTHLYGGLLKDIATNQGFRYWNRSLEKGSRITQSCLGKNVQIGKHGYLGINVLDTDREASEAFRFAFTLALIVLFHKMEK